jgi:hypothetical protein
VNNKETVDALQEIVLNNRTKKILLVKNLKQKMLKQREEIIKNIIFINEKTTEINNSNPGWNIP